MRREMISIPNPPPHSSYEFRAASLFFPADILFFLLGALQSVKMIYIPSDHFSLRKCTSNHVLDVPSFPCAKVCNSHTLSTEVQIAIPTIEMHQGFMIRETTKESPGRIPSQWILSRFARRLCMSIAVYTYTHGEDVY